MVYRFIGKGGPWGQGDSMQIIFLSKGQTLFLFFLLWPLFQVSAALLCYYLPDRFFDPNAFWYRSHPFEQGGRIYAKWFKIKRWKQWLPDGGAVFKRKGFRKKHLKETSWSYFNQFLIESCRAELTHWLAILPFGIFGFFAGPGVVGVMLGYALLVNVPCILVQRFNRPRIKAMMGRMEKSEG